mgnify:CR=1 FL=1
MDKIDLQVNGRLFPAWVMMNFKKYTLPEIMRKDGEDPCNEKIKKELTVYQKFLGQYLSYKSPFKDILVYHGLGSGKTVSAINIYNVLFNYTPKWNVFLLIKASLRDDPWLKDLGNWLEPKEKELRMKNIVFISYDAPNADTQFLEAVKKSDSSKGNLFIFDEAHNFIRNVYGNISSKKGKRAQVIYDYIVQEKKESGNARVVLLSATPAINQPYELALIYNLLRPGSFPDNESAFNQLYISSSNFMSLNEETKNMFQRRIMGLVSYYIGATPDKFAQQTVHYKNIVMEKYHEDIYNHFEQIEEEKEKIRRKFARGKVGQDEMSTYSSYTRQACNFVFPTLGTKITGEDRPRPGHFRIRDEDAEVVDEGKDTEKTKELKKSKEEVADYIKAITNYINIFIEHLKDLHRKDKDSGHTLKTDVEDFFKKYEGSFTKFYTEAKKKSKLFETLYMCSPKFIQIIFNILKSKGPVLVYSNYVAMEGLQIFKIYLNFFGFISFDDDKEVDVNKLDKKLSRDGHRFIEFHGGIDKDLREANKKFINRFNSMEELIIEKTGMCLKRQLKF